MIFINREQDTVLIPKHINSAEPIRLTLKHNLTGTEYVFEDLPNDDTSLIFWTFQGMNFSNLQTGEYTYSINDIETGLLMVTSKIAEPISYDSEKTIVQYGG